LQGRRQPIGGRRLRLAKSKLGVIAMMETIGQHTGTISFAAGWPANNNSHAPLSMRGSAFPQDAVARIWKPSRSPMTSAKARSERWRLGFQRRSAPFAEPLMGWTGSDDVMSGVELEFPTLESAIRHAERQGLPYVIET
jgi:hypothetical protein